jgi:hypothetical protein
MTPHRRASERVLGGLARGFASPLLLLLVALVLRLGVALALPPPDDFVDLMEPGRTAANLAAGRGYTFDFYGTRPDRPLQAFLPPLHPWLIALALQFARPAAAYGLFQALLGSLTVWLLYRLAEAMAGWRAGLLAGWAATLYPAHVLLVGQPHSTVLHACILVAILLACWRVLQRPVIARALLAGGLVGILALGRPQIVVFVPIVAGWLWLNHVRGWPLRRAAGALALATAVVILPWCLRNSLLFGRLTFISTNGGVTFWNGNNPFTTGSAHDVYADQLADYRGVERDSSLPDVYQHPEPYPFPPEIEVQLAIIPELQLDGAAYRAGLAYIRHHLIDWLELETQKLVSFWWFRPNLGSNPLYRGAWTDLYRVQYVPVLVLTVVGLVISARHWRRFALLYAVLIFYTLVHLAFNVLTRYRWEIELLMLIFAALAVDAIWQQLVGRRAA